MLAYLLLGLRSDGTGSFDRKLRSAPRCQVTSVANMAGLMRSAPLAVSGRAAAVRPDTIRVQLTLLPLSAGSF
jgi:hypothetical protein